MNHDALRFDGQVAVVSGAGRGLGRAIALALATRGASVVVNDHGADITGATTGDAGPARAVVQEIRALGGRAEAVVADIGSAAGVRATLDAATQRLGGLHIIVHNASPIMAQTAFEDASQEGFELTLRVNAAAAWELARQGWRHFKAQRYGRIVLINSAAGLWGRKGMPAYSLGKSSMSGFAKYLSIEGEPFGVRTNCLAPVAYTRVWEGQNVDPALAALMPAAQVAEVAALLAHESCPVNGELFHSAGTHLSRVVVAQTQGVSFDPATFSAEQVLRELPEVMSTAAFDLPTDADQSGAAMLAHRMASDAHRLDKGLVA